MRLLMFNTGEIWYRTYQKIVVIVINVEKEDEVREDTVVRKAADNITWLAKKTGRTTIVLHSFAHLSDSKSEIGFASNLFIRLHDRLAAKGYLVTVTPFGYLNEFRIHVLGESLAKVWKSI